MHHGPRSWDEIRLADVMPLFFFLHHALNEFREFFVARAAPHLGVQVVVPDGEQAGANFSVAGNADTAAMSAERMRHRRDDANLADAIFKAVAPRRFRARVRDLHQRPVLGHARQNFVKRTTVEGAQVRPSSSGMNSMKRTVTPSSRANMPKGMI